LDASIQDLTPVDSLCLVTAALASLLPAVRAARLDPMRVLRED
jgi:ABC-type lipoprotein release transport system permease subunit